MRKFFSLPILLLVTGLARGQEINFSRVQDMAIWYNQSLKTDKQSSLLVRTDGPVLDPAWAVKPVSLEDLVLAYMSRAGETPARRQHLGVVS